MKSTLLELTQDILSAMDSDEVNSISDTVESAQVAKIIRRTYYDIISRTDLKEHKELFELESSNDTTKPTLMYLPSTVIGVEWIKYKTNVEEDNDLRYSEIFYLCPKDFFERQNYLNVSQPNVISFSHTINSDTFEFFVLNDKMPQYYTSWDDGTVIMDSYDSGEDTYLVKNKTMCYGTLYDLFLLEDSFIPDLDPRMFALLYNKASARCFAELKQMSNAAAEREERRQWIGVVERRNQQIPDKTNPLAHLPNYGKPARGKSILRYGRNSW